MLVVHLNQSDRPSFRRLGLRRGTAVAGNAEGLVRKRLGTADGTEAIGEGTTLERSPFEDIPAYQSQFVLRNMGFLIEHLFFLRCSKDFLRYSVSSLASLI